MELEMESPSTELYNLGLKLLSYPFGAVAGVNTQRSSQSFYQSLAPTSVNAVVRLFLKRSFPKLEDCSLVVFSLQKRLVKLPHA